jgi:rhodanese-related sulfurtransferase
MNTQIEYYQSKLDYEMDPSDLFSALENGEKIVPLDTRKTVAYELEHIPGAINLPHREMNEKTTAFLQRCGMQCFNKRCS